MLQEMRCDLIAILPQDMLSRIYTTLDLTSQIALKAVCHATYRLFESPLQVKAISLIQRTTSHIGKQAYISSSNCPSSEAAKERLSIFLKHLAKVHRLLSWHQPLFYKINNVWQLLAQMFDSLEIDPEYGQLDNLNNQFERVRANQSKTFDILVINHQLTLAKPLFFSQTPKKFVLVFKCFQKATQTEPMYWGNVHKWRYWIALQRADGNLMNLEELTFCTAIEMCFNACVKLVCRCNVQAIPFLLKTVQYRSLHDPVISCNQYGLFSKSKGITMEMRCFKSEDQLQTFALPIIPGDLRRCQGMRRHTFASLFRQHVIDCSLEKYNRKQRTLQ